MVGSNMMNLRLGLLFSMGLAHWALLSEAQNGPQDFLSLHNAARAEVGVGPLRWDQTLQAYAEEYAQVRSADCAIVHSGGPYGENVYMGYGAGYNDVAAAMKYWVDEKSDYDYGGNTCIAGKDCLHYTQIVWRKTQRVGCARMACAGGEDKYFITCNYDPMGNIDGEKPY